MPLKPRIKVKAKGVSIDDYEGKGIPIGPYQVVVDAAGKATIKPKRKPRPLPQEIASRKKRRYKPAK